MEGVAGIVDRSQVDPEGREYALGRRLMTAEVNAVVEGAFQAGASEVVVCDAHWNNRNLLWDALDARARVVSGKPRPLGMMAGIDETFDAALFLGCHAREGHPRGVLAHTWSHTAVDELRLAGRPAGEIALNAAIAGHFGVPVVLVAGDRWACEEALETLGEVETVAVKEGLSPTAASSLVPARATALIREKVEIAVRDPGRYEAWELERPVEIEVRFKEAVQAGRATAGRSGVERVDGKTVRVTGEDVVEAFAAFATLF